jgi:hypothetical protein
MDEWILFANVKRFGEMLRKETDEQRRRHLQKLLEDEQEKLRRLKDGGPNRDSSQPDQTADCGARISQTGK